ncbi:trigger factor [Marispirochaeta aestuarii]|uniref:Trigger factor n=1 Tax=Marispirochaeta aestuarii TaxID=1963862 RepID=A0A1Y1S081_9SPIO|nr:trigger factor [Marispirochaeta aestuarii]ORC36565.1 trigger factor [Marispirochaeta aestuarii]
MVANKEIEKLEKSAVKLTVTVAKEDVRKEFDGLVDKYCKTAHVKGFRKGKVPAGILLQKYGESIRYETSMKVIEESLKELFEEIEERPIAYSTPELQDEALVNEDEDFTFSVKYDVFPDITLGEYKGLTVEEPEVKVGKKEIDEELEKIRDQNSVVMEKEKPVEKDDIVTVDYVELDENGQEVEGTRREDFVFTVGSGYNMYKIDDDLVGMKTGEEKEIKKSFPEDFEYQELAGSEKTIKVSLKVVKEKQLPALDDELAQDVNEKFETLKDLKDDIKKRLESSLEQRLRSIKIDSLLEQIVEKSEIDVPESMVAAELENSWRNFQMQSRMSEDQLLQLLSIQGKDKAALLAEWRDDAEKSLKAQLVIGKLIEAEDIKVNDEDYEKELAEQAERSDMTLEQTREYVDNNNMEEYLRSDLLNRKLFDRLLEISEVKKGKKESYVDVMNRNK